MRICVTQEDIKRGKRHSATRCPIARAATAATRTDCGVGMNTLYIYQKNVETIDILLPVNARNFRHDFDNGLCVEPIEFEVDFEL